MEGRGPGTVQEMAPSREGHPGLSVPLGERPPRALAPSSPFWVLWDPEGTNLVAFPKVQLCTPGMNWGMHRHSPHPTHSPSLTLLLPFSPLHPLAVFTLQTDWEEV